MTNDRRSELLAYAISSVDHWWRVLAKLYPRIKAQPSVVISKRMTKTAGFMIVGDRQMRLSYALMLANLEDYHKDTIPHELAHQVAYDIYGIGKEKSGRTPWHGAEWQGIMKTLGIKPTRTHDYL